MVRYFYLSSLGSSATVAPQKISAWLTSTSTLALVSGLTSLANTTCGGSPGDYERYRDEGTEKTLKVQQTFNHPDYDSMTLDNDIALMRLENPAPFSEYILPICLPSKDLAERVLHLNGTMTVVTGWGTDEQDSTHYASVLNVIKVPLVEHSVCSAHMSNNISQNVLCAGFLGQRMDACNGDSGGPMVTLYRNTWFLVGLVSWGESCGRVDKLGIYTKVSNYNEWINRVREEWDKSHGPQPRVPGP